MREQDIVHEEGDFWVLKTPKGYEVYRIRATHSVRCAVIGYTGEIGLEKAKAEISRRINLEG